LLRAVDLYAPPIYSKLAGKFGETNLFILSAGWGLVKSTYLLPYYDITFSHKKGVPAECGRGQLEMGWNDFDHLKRRVKPGEEVHCFVTLDYLPLLCQLTRSYKGNCRIVIHYKSSTMPRKDGYRYEKYTGSAKTNWHYQAAKEFMECT
jgi:hypothetical protein